MKQLESKPNNELKQRPVLRHSMLAQPLVIYKTFLDFGGKSQKDSTVKFELS